MSESKQTVDLDGLTLAYAVAGDENAPPVVLLHGGGFDSALVSWRPVLPSLSDSFRVYAPDWPGYGESDQPERTPTTEYYIDVLDRFLDTVDIDHPSLVGVSLGGGIAIGYAFSRPEHVHRLVAVDSYGLGGDVPGGMAAALFVRSERLSGALWSLIQRSQTLARLSVRAAVYPPNLTDDLIDDALTELDRPHATEAWQAFQRTDIGLRGLQTNYVGRFSDLAVPVLFIHGERDSFIPVEWAVRAKTLAPDADLRVFGECGHWTPRERPEAFVTAVEPFLKREKT